MHVALSLRQLMLTTSNPIIERSFIMSSYRASMAARSSAKKKEGMLQPLLEEEDDESTVASASATSESSASTEYEKYKPTFMQRLKQTVGKSIITCLAKDTWHLLYSITNACYANFLSCVSANYFLLYAHICPYIYFSEHLPNRRRRSIRSRNDIRSGNNDILSRWHMHRKCPLLHVQRTRVEKDPYTSIFEQ